MLFQYAPDHLVFPQGYDIVFAGGEDSGGIVLVLGVGGTGSGAALERRDQRGVLELYVGQNGTGVGAEGGHDALPAVSGADADVFGNGSVGAGVGEKLLHKLVFDGKEGGEAHAYPAVVVGERGGGEADAGLSRSSAGDTLALCDGGGSGCLE